MRVRAIPPSLCQLKAHSCPWQGRKVQGCLITGAWKQSSFIQFLQMGSLGHDTVESLDPEWLSRSQAWVILSKFETSVSHWTYFYLFGSKKGLLSGSKQSKDRAYSLASHPRSVYKPLPCLQGLWHSPFPSLYVSLPQSTFWQELSSVNYHGGCTSYRAWIIEGRRKWFVEDVHVQVPCTYYCYQKQVRR